MQLIFNPILIGLSVAHIVLVGLYSCKTCQRTTSQSRKFNFISGSWSIISAVTSVLATLLIGYQIFSSTKHDKRSRKRYGHIFKILIHSSAIYSIVIVADAICAISNTGKTSDLIRNLHIGIVDNYISALQMFTTVSSHFPFGRFIYY